MGKNVMAYALAVDVIAGVLIVVSGYLAMVRGAVRELLALASWGVAFVVAFAFAANAKPIVEQIPGVGAKLASQCQIALLVAFVLVFAVALIVCAIAIWLLVGKFTGTVSSVADQVGGAAFGVLRGLVLVAVIYIAYVTAFPKSEQFQFVDDAHAIGLIQGVANVVQAATPDAVPSWLETRVSQLLEVCGDS